MAKKTIDFAKLIQEDREQRQPEHWQGTFLDNFDYLASNIMMPLGGLLITVFCGWIMSEASAVDELAIGSGQRYRIWRFLSRYVAPLARRRRLRPR